LNNEHIFLKSLSTIKTILYSLSTGPTFLVPERSSWQPAPAISSHQREQTEEMCLAASTPESSVQDAQHLHGSGYIADGRGQVEAALHPGTAQQQRGVPG